ncbi:hypothetical protein FGG08_001011 [Glutinoglossum americanum]|uniref:Uncharacterized protein n=1 Tax=Glutinoglossum americanum TaxID=1670608 RepID=A0A9P8L395_9PEZI|nr:hypothetical protein FGG08_001011 [Glutinoglossum americanum]
MLDGLFMLLSLSTVMAIASFLAGSLPLSMTMSQSKLRLISAIGMGVLVGTSLVVIIPEGIETLYSAGKPDHTSRRGEVESRSVDVRWLAADERLVGRTAGPSRKVKKDNLGTETLKVLRQRLDGASASKTPAIDAPPPTDTGTAGPIPSYPHGKQPSSNNPEGHPGKEGDSAPPKGHDGDQPRSPHAYVGLSLILGFILMYLIDQLPQHASSNSRNYHQPYHISLDNLSQGIRSSFAPNTHGTGADDGLLDQPYPPQPTKSRSFATTTGLVIHAAADGIALGASSSAAHSSLGFIVFFAIMIHKAPAAFGLTSVLLKQGLSKRQARGHLIIFSLAAPAGALVTWMLIAILGRGRMGGEEGTQWWTGVLLLFSAGTFLYVAMHTMQEDSSSRHEPSVNGYANGGGPQHRKEGPQMRDTAAAVAGMLIPLVTQFGHHH